jgi:hypothetical protein
MSEYDDDLIIDKYNLDSECVDQPRRFMKYGTLYAQAVLERDKIKQRLKIAKAESDEYIRKNFQIMGIEKLTEAVVGNLIERQPEVQKLVGEYLEAEYRVNILEVAKEAFRDRRNELSNLVQLFHDGYWAAPRISADKMEGLPGAEAPSPQKVMPSLKDK